MDPIELTGLRAQEYEHPDDAAALSALKEARGLKTLIEFLSGFSSERMLRIQLTGSFVRVTEDGFPELWEICLAARNRLSLPQMPEVYICNGEEINAFTAGAKNPIVVLNSGSIDHLDDDELLFVIAHEMGHIKSGHVLYYQMAALIPKLGSLVGDMTLGIGKFLSLGLQAALLHWQRTSELTADRAGLLACQDGEKALRALMKLAGVPRKYSDRANVEAFRAQARQFEAFDFTTADKVAKYLSLLGATHPWTVMRARELLLWIDNGSYDRILMLSRSDTSHYCTGCGKEAKTGQTFCGRCGHRFPALSTALHA